MKTKGIKQFLSLVIVFAMIFTMMMPITAIAAVAVTGITVTGAGGASTVIVGSTLAMSADVLPADADDKTVNWSVASGTGTATINATTGVLTGTGAGTVNVIATAHDGSGAIGMTTITVTAAPVAVTGIIVTGAGGASTVVNGSTLQMSAGISPANATDKTVNWSVIAGTGTATINATTGVLTGTGVGTVTVIATAHDGSGVSGTKTITVIAPVAVTGITVTGAGNAVTVLKNRTLQMSAAISPANATDKTVTWSVVAGTGTATIDASGLLTGTGVGTVTVIATANGGLGVSDTKTITVTEPVTGIIVTGAGGANTVAEGSTLAMSAAVQPATAADKTVTWSVAAGTGTATINATTGVLTGTGVGTVTVKATANDGSSISGTTTITVTAAPVAVTGITVTGAGGASTVVNGGTLQMSAVISPANATDKTVTWSVVAGTGTATINATTGVLTGTGVGTVTVKATANDGSSISGTTTITVTASSIPVTGIIVTGAGGASTVVNGGTLQMSAAISPANATNQSVTWSVASLAGGTATINATTGVLTGTGAGTVTVKATANDGSGIFGTTLITVTAPIAVTGITVTAAGGGNTVVAGSTLQMNATIFPDNATNRSVTWSVARLVGGTAIIDPTTGVLTGIGVGTVTVKATANDGSNTIGTKTITVVASPILVTGITVAGAGGESTVANGGTLQMKATVLPANATDSSVIWSVAAGTGTATIDATTGVLTGAGVGTVTVTATAHDGSGKSGTTTITVAAVIVTGIAVTGEANVITVVKDTGTLQMYASVLPANATDSSVTWSVAAGTGTATINPQTGLLSGTGLGTVTVKATANDGSQVYGEKTITVVAAPIAVTSITVTGAGNISTVAKNGTLQMTASAQPSNATDFRMNWSVAPGTGRATINPATGLLTGTEVGTVTVTATSVTTGAATGTKVITVNDPFTIAAPVLPSATTTGVPVPITITNYGNGKGPFVWSWTGVTLQDTTVPTAPVDIAYTYAAGTGNNDMTITPTTMLDFGKTYTLKIPAGTVTDSLLNPNAAFSFELTTPPVGISSIELTIPITPTTPTGRISSIDLLVDPARPYVPLDTVITLTTNGTLNPLIPITLSADGNNCKLEFWTSGTRLLSNGAKGAETGNNRKLAVASDGNQITVVPVYQLEGGSNYTLTIPAGALMDSTGAINDASSITFTTAYNLDDLINGVYNPVTLNKLLEVNAPIGLDVNVSKRYMTKFEISYSTNSTNPLTNVDITAKDEVKKIIVQFGTNGPTYKAVKGNGIWNTGYEGSLTTVDDSGAIIGQDITFQAFDEYGRLLEKKRTIKLNVKGNKLDLSKTESLIGARQFAQLIRNSGKPLQDILKEYTLNELTLSVRPH